MTIFVIPCAFATFWKVPMQPHWHGIVEYHIRQKVAVSGWLIKYVLGKHCWKRVLEGEEGVVASTGRCQARRNVKDLLDSTYVQYTLILFRLTVVCSDDSLRCSRNKMLSMESYLADRIHIEAKVCTSKFHRPRAEAHAPEHKAGARKIGLGSGKLECWGTGLQRHCKGGVRKPTIYPWPGPRCLLLPRHRLCWHSRTPTHSLMVAASLDTASGSIWHLITF